MKERWTGIMGLVTERSEARGVSVTNQRLKKCHHLPLPLLSDNQVNGLVSGSGSVSSVRSSGSGEDQSQPTAPRKVNSFDSEKHIFSSANMASPAVLFHLSKKRLKGQVSGFGFDKKMMNQISFHVNPSSLMDVSDKIGITSIFS
ncbi:hypothetical protein YC2023_005276 [Brassica napus]